MINSIASFRLVLLAGLLLTGGRLLAADVILVAHPDVSVSSLTKSEVKSLFLGTKVTLGDDRAVLVARRSGSVHKSFLSTYVGKTVSQFKTYWKRRVFTGKGTPPKAFSSEKSLLAHVARTKGALGYVAKGADTKGLKVISVGQ